MRNHHGVKKPTEEAAIRSMSRSDVKMRKALTVAHLAIELCLDDLKRR